MVPKRVHFCDECRVDASFAVWAPVYGVDQHNFSRGQQDLSFCGYARPNLSGIVPHPWRPYGYGISPDAHNDPMPRPEISRYREGRAE